MQYSVLAGYMKAAAEKALAFDPAQQAIARQLDMLGSELEAAASSGFFKKLLNPPELRGLYIWGAVGRGKTMLMDLFYNNVSVPQKKRVHFHAFMRDVHQGIFEARQKEMPDPLVSVAKEIAASAQLLCFDEFAVTDVADAMILSRLFGVLFEKKVVIVATSNVAPEHLYEGGLNRPLFVPFIQLLQRQMTVLKLSAAKDYRLETFEKSGVYFSGDHAEKAFNAAWAAFLHGAKEEPAHLLVKGRDLAFTRSGNGALRADFSKLCETALGAEDYLEIARRFHTLFLENIPVFTSERLSALRRFIHLIDILYDHRVNLVALTAAEPKVLAEGFDGYEGEAFARTASRLIEMRSSAYLGKAHLKPAGALETTAFSE